MLDDKIKKRILSFQRNEITEYVIYNNLSRLLDDSHNKEILRRIADDELKHYEQWKEQTQKPVKPDRFKIVKCHWIAKIRGLTFGIKLMERSAARARVTYGDISNVVPDAKNIARDEEAHGKELIGLCKETRKEASV